MKMSVDLLVLDQLSNEYDEQNVMKVEFLFLYLHVFDYDLKTKRNR